MKKPTNTPPPAVAAAPASHEQRMALVRAMLDPTHPRDPWTWRDRLHCEWLMKKAWYMADYAFDHADEAGLELWHEDEYTRACEASWAEVLRGCIVPDDADVAHTLYRAAFVQRLAKRYDPDADQDAMQAATPAPTVH